MRTIVNNSEIGGEESGALVDSARRGSSLNLMTVNGRGAERGGEVATMVTQEGGRRGGSESQRAERESGWEDGVRMQSTEDG